MTNRGIVLVVDDDKDYVESTAAILESGGYEVLKAYSGREGTELAHSRKPGLILLDIMMEEKTTGYDVLRKIREHAELATVPVIIISSLYHEGPNFQLDPSAGVVPADLFLAKPIDPPHLLAETARLMGKPSTPASRKK